MSKSNATHKWCPKCLTMKNKKQFNKHKNRHDGLQSNCRQCLSEQQKNVITIVIYSLYGNMKT
jgi:hypothetical protein